MLVPKEVDAHAECMNEECIEEWERESHDFVVPKFTKCFMEEAHQVSNFVYLMEEATPIDPLQGDSILNCDNLMIDNDFFVDTFTNTN